MEFKDKIKSLRLECGFTMEDLAKKIGVSTPTIQRYESGEIKNIRRDKIKSLADALNTDPLYLMDIESTPEYKEGTEKARLLKKYSLLSSDNKQVVLNLIDNLLQTQHK